MGMSCIAFLRDDAIDVARHDSTAWDRIRSELGEALLTLCIAVAPPSP